MIKDKKELKHLTIDLTGPQGNAFFLLRQVDSLGKILGKNKKEISKIKMEMMLSDYEMLIQTFDKYFGSIVVLYR